ncbi:MAG: dihydrolipoyl dehydrogenase [Deltaproteobacteria bacterium]|jgi:dihydrolipoamide dehydrogenase|nr:dihydrolipoyl dehydrogenase [Deltaproteobacteria bacterium]MBT4527636.1 dihydrolipoyl dehydrogenase [Deltaproteobacteria bacterium]
MKYDVIVIGSGPGGYVAAIKCAQLKLKTAIIEKYSDLGGTCLNVGCIPSKALLDSSYLYESAQHQFDTHGIQIEKLSFDWEKIQNRKNKIVKEVNLGVSHLMKKNNIDVYQGMASFIDNHQVQIDNNDQLKSLYGEKIIIATGSKPGGLPGIQADGKKIITSTEALSLKNIPEKLLIIGAGAIGLEIGSIYRRLGSTITCIEYLDTIIPNMDTTMSKELLRVLKKQGIKFKLGHEVQSVKVDGSLIKLLTKNRKNGTEQEFEGDQCLLSVGRIPNTQSLNLDKIKLALTDRGFITVNENLETSVTGIYAIGDVIGGSMLAHKAIEEAIFVAEQMSGQKPKMYYQLIPAVVYTEPEVASVGLTEQQVKQKKLGYKTGTHHFRALGRAKAAGKLDGLVKIIANDQTDEIYGVHIFGTKASEMIGEAVTALGYKASSEDLARLPHAHPSFSEAIKDAALDVLGHAIHS